MSTPLQFAVKMFKMREAAQTMPKTILRESALTLKTSVQAHLKVAAPSGRLNVGKNGKKVGVRYDLAPVAKVYMTGPAQLIERDTKPHRIPRERTRRGKAKVVNIPGVGVRAWANHPGTKGKYPWRNGLAAGLPLVEKAAGDVVRDAFRKAMR